MITPSLVSLLTDPLLRASTWGSLFMCLVASLVGVIIVVQKRSLIGEALSHACYPGVVLGVVVAAALFPKSDKFLALSILTGAVLAAYAGVLTIEALERKLKIKPDASICFVLSIFFGVGILIASRIQFTHTIWYKQIQLYLYGQVATMTDVYILIYGVLALLTLLFLILFFPRIEATYFDRSFSSSIGISVRMIDMIVFALLALAIVVGMRSVGLILMSGMLIAPAVTARQLVKKLSSVFIVAGIFGMASALLGNYFSLSLSLLLRDSFPSFSLPTGPLIVLMASLFCLLSLLFSPQKGLVVRLYRRTAYKMRCVSENLIKSLWKRQSSMKKEEFFPILHQKMLLSFLLFKLQFEGWLVKENGCYNLTDDGKKRALHIVRLHRLWEVYLVDYLGQNVDKVHSSAEQMEHVITPSLEDELIQLMNDPKKDPHDKPIPEREEI